MVQETRVRLSRESLRHRRAQGQRLENTKVGGLGGYGESSERLSGKQQKQQGPRKKKTPQKQTGQKCSLKGVSGQVVSSLCGYQQR